jgi:hypothetical protein
MTDPAPPKPGPPGNMTDATITTEPPDDLDLPPRYSTPDRTVGRSLNGSGRP